MTDHDSLDSQIFRLTIAMFAAAPGAAVLAELRNALTGGESVENLAHNLVRTDVYKLLYPDSLDTVEFSARFALDVLRAEVGPVQMAYAIKELTALQRDGLDRAQTVLRAIDALLAVDPANSEWGNARQAFENKLTVAAYYSVERQKSAHSLAELQKVVALVTSNPCSVQAAKDQIDGVAPSHVVLLVSPCLLTDTGVNSSVHAGGTTRDNTVSIAGTVSDPRAVTAVEVLDGSLVLGTAIVAATGDWRFTTPPLADGDHTLTVRTVGAGCHAVTSLPLVFRVDTSSPVDAPSGTLLISGTVAQNSVLTAIITGVTDPDSMGGLHFQWLRNGSVISGATSQTYTLGEADVGKVISVRVSYTDGQGTPGTLTSAPTEFPAPPPVASLLIATQGPLSVAEHAEFNTTLTLSEQLGVQGEISWHLVQDSATAAAADWARVTLGSRTGQLALLPKDYEHPDDADGDGVYRVQIYARDSDGLSSPAVDMAITVTDLNDNAPVFTSGATGAVEENAVIATAIYTATTTDADGTAPNRSVVYSLKADTGDVAALDIDADTGVVTLKASADFEAKASYSFTVVAINGSLPPTEQAVTVSVTDLNDNAPVFTSGATGTVEENADPATAIYTATTSDADGTAANHSVVYSLKADTGDVDALNIDADTGVVTLKASADHEAKASYSFTVVATNGALATEQAVTVTVTDLNDNAPAFSSGATGAVEENAFIATAIYTATTTDADGTAANRSVVYSLKADTGDVAALDINADTGVVTLKASADHETKASYSFTVVATNGSLPPTEQAVTVSVTDLNDNAPVFTSGATGTVEENADPATAIYTATTSDADGTAPNRSVVYSLKADTGDVAALDINSGTGAVTLKNSADHETKTSYTFTVVATNGSLPPTEQAVTVTVTDRNDNAPVFTSGATGTVEESATIATPIYTATTTDADGTAPNRTVVYSLKPGTGDVAALDINADTGVVTLKASADHETKASYSFTVVATNGSLPPTEQAVTVSVTDRNDNAPVFTSSATGSVEENAVATTAIYTATTSDADGTAANRSVVYSLKAATGDVDALNIDATSGVVTLKASADHETKASYSFTVVATNGSLATERAVTVSVTNIPTVLEVANPGPLSVNENTAFSTTLALSQQVEVQGPITWHLVDGSAGAAAADGHLFVLNSATGTLTLSAQDYERPDDADADHVYRVQVFARDGADTRSPALSLALSVGNVAETTVLTVVGAPVSTGTILENTDTASDAAVVARLQVSGMTDVAADVLSWHLVVDDRDDLDNARFTLGTDGILRLNRADFESAFVHGRRMEGHDYDDNDYLVDVYAADADGNTSAAVSIRVVVGDIVEDRPEGLAITSSDSALSAVDEQTGTGAASAVLVDTLTMFNAIGQAHWELLAGLDASRFSVHATSGELKFTPPDREAAEFDARDPANPSDWVFSVVVRATDDDQHVVERTLSVQLNDVVETRNLVISTDAPAEAQQRDENAQALLGSYSLAVASAAPVGTLTWSLDGADAARFRLEINSSTGAASLYLNAQDFEEAGSDNHHTVQVRATDRQGNTQLADAVTVQVLDAPVEITSASTMRLTDGVAASFSLQGQGPSVDSNSVVWSVEGDSDDLLNLIAAQPSVGATTLQIRAQDYETPGDSDQNHRYQVTLVATATLAEGGSYVVRQGVEFLVDDVPLRIHTEFGTDEGGVQELMIYENVDTASDAARASGLALRIDSDSATGTLSWRLTGADVGRFELDTASGYLRLKTQNFEYDDPVNPDRTADDVYEVTLVAEDKAADGSVLQTASQAFRVQVQNVDEPPAAYGITLVTAGLSAGGEYPWGETTPIVLAMAFNDGFGYSPPNGEVQWELRFTNSTGPLNIPFTRSGNTSTISPLDWESVGAGGQINLSIDAIDEEGTRPGELWFDDFFAGDFEAPIQLGFNIQDVNEPRTLTIQGLPSVLWNENDTTQFWVPTGVDAQVVAPGPPSEPATPYRYSKVVSGTAGSFGADHARFLVDANTGAVTLAAALNREGPSDANGDNIYHLTLRVDDDEGNFDFHDLAVQIAGVDETTRLAILHGDGQAITAPFALIENNFFTTTLSAVALDPATDRGALHWSLEPGAPAGLQIEESTGVLSWIQPNYEATTGGTVTATVRVTDSDIGPEGLSPNEATQTITFQIADNDYEVEVAGGYRQVIAERSDFAVAVSLLHDSLSIDQAGVAWSLTGEDANDFVVSGGMLRWNSAGNGGLPDFEAPKDGVGDTGGNNVYQALLEAKNTSSGEVLVSQFIQLSVSNLRVAATVATTRSPVGTAYNTETVPSPATLSGISFSNPEEGGLAEVEWDLASMTAAGWNLGGNASIRSITGTSTLGSFSFEPTAAGSTTGGVITYYVNPSYAATEAYRYLAHFQGITDRVTLAVAGGNSLEAEFRVSGVEDRPEIPAPTGGGTAQGVVATVAEDPGSPVVLTANMLRLASGATDPDDQDSVNVFVVTQVSGPGTLLIGTSRATATPWRAATDTDPGNCQIGQRDEKPQNLVNDSYDYYIGYWIPDDNAHGVLTARVFAMEAVEPVLFNLSETDSVTAALAALNKRSVNGFDAQVEVTAVNDAPELTLFATEVTVEANGTVPVSEDLLWSDPDDATPAMLTVQLTGGYAPGVDSLSVAENLAGTGLQAVWSDAEGRLVISALAGQTPTELDWTNVLESIQYANTNPDDAGATRHLRFTVQDHGDLTASVDLPLVFATASAPKAGQGSLNPVLSDELVQIVGLPDVHASNEMPA